jgi:hypothetical protein
MEGFLLLPERQYPDFAALERAKDAFECIVYAMRTRHPLREYTESWSDNRDGETDMSLTWDEGTNMLAVTTGMPDGSREALISYHSQCDGGWMALTEMPYASVEEALEIFMDHILPLVCGP